MSARPFAAAYGPWALVAGGSEGLGAAFAHELARRGLHLVLVARRPGPLDHTAGLIRQATGAQVLTVAADLAAPGAIDQVTEAVADRPVGLVVANAATSPTGAFTAISAADVSAVADLNCRATALLAHRFLPPMADRGRGGLILMSSLAGLQGVPGLAVYSASKAFLITLAEALWAENRGSGVDVIACCAGAVTTPGYQQAARRTAPGATTPEHVATVALDALGHGFRVVPGPLNKLSTVALERLLPKRAAIAVFGRASAATLRDPAG
ncbi:MAG TPA: SDR family NAD(P)-dependent oxidoreductase [Streptosporangiaceae bacterium]